MFLLKIKLSTELYENLSVIADYYNMGRQRLILTLQENFYVGPLFLLAIGEGLRLRIPTVDLCSQLHVI